MRVQRVRDTAGIESWTVVQDDYSVVEPIEQFLAHLAALDRSPNTTSAYAFDLRDFSGFSMAVERRGRTSPEKIWRCSRVGCGWRRTRIAAS
jgi:hypothetical protein